MPRGPGKKDNYNLDYSRFSGVGADAASAHSDRDPRPGDTAGPPPEMGFDMQEALSKCPPELQEAMRMMAISRATGDKAAEQRANELALKAVEAGTPEVKERFMQELSKQCPEAVEHVRPPPEARMHGGISDLQAQLEKGREEANQEMQRLKKHQEELEKLHSPEDFFKFFEEQGGLSPEDLQRCFAGDEEHMKKAMSKMLGGVTKADETALAKTETAVKAVEQFHAVLHGEADLPDGSEAPKTVAAKAAPKEPPPAEVRIPVHRLQYQKDASGRCEVVELRCQLPGVSDMSKVQLDVGERYMRLVTCEPGPVFAVNAGPFPVLVSAAAARAKFSKKRQELVVTVPAAPDP